MLTTPLYEIDETFFYFFHNAQGNPTCLILRNIEESGQSFKDQMGWTEAEAPVPEPVSCFKGEQVTIKKSAQSGDRQETSFFLYLLVPTGSNEITTERLRFEDKNYTIKEKQTAPCNSGTIYKCLIEG
jgi:hypothetical protein